METSGDALLRTLSSGYQESRESKSRDINLWLKCMGNAGILSFSHLLPEIVVAPFHTFIERPHPAKLSRVLRLCFSLLFVWLLHSPVGETQGQPFSLFEDISYRTIILPVVLCGCETWSLILREESRLRVFENRILRWVFGPKRDENGECRRLHIEELHSLYRSPNIVRMLNLED